MVSEITINRLENVLTEVVDFSGTKEQTTIVSNMEVVNASPAGLSGFVTIKDDRDGDTILATKLPGVVYTTGDLVNVLFIDGTEPIAFQQASGSASANGLWQLEGDTGPDIFYDDGNVGIGTATIPHGGVGGALLALDGPDSSINGPHIQVTTDADDFPVIQYLNFSHDNISWIFDAYFDGVSVKSSDGGSNFRLLKVQDTFRFEGDFGRAQGAVVGFDEFITLSVSEIIFNNDSINLDFRVEGNGDANLLFTDAGNDRVGIGTSAPQKLLHIGPGTDAPTVGTDGAYIALDGDANLSVRDNTNNVEGFMLAFNTGIVYVGAATNHPLQLRTNNADRLRILNSGEVGIGITAPTAQLHVDQASTTAAIPVVFLDQADISEPFVRFEGTAAAATLTQSIVAEADVTTATRQGFVQVFVTDIGNQITDQAYFMPLFTLA